MMDYWVGRTGKCIQINTSKIDPSRLKRIYYDVDQTERWKEAIKDRQPRLEYVSGLQIRYLTELDPHHGRCAIVGAGPSIKDHIDEIRKFQDVDIIISLNGAHDYLIKHGVTPRIHIIFETDLESVEHSTCGPPHKDVYYYICSHCHQSIFESLEDYHRVAWHCFDEPPEYQALIAKLFPKQFMVGGGFVTLFKAINIASILGYRSFELFGCECSFTGENTHYEGYQNKTEEGTIVVAAGTLEEHKTFHTTPTLSFLASEVIRFCATNQRGIRIKVHGDGLLRHLHQMEYPEVYQDWVELYGPQNKTT